MDKNLKRYWGKFVRDRGGEPAFRDAHLVEEFLEYYNKAPKLPKYKIAVVFICTKFLYWPYAKEAIEGARQMLLPGHDKDFFLWSDVPKDEKDFPAVIEDIKRYNPQVDENGALKEITELSKYIYENMTVYPTEATEWPYPTLMRYHLFLQQEEKLREYDYIMYCDIDMKYVDLVGDEILGEKLTIAQHPMYALRDGLYFPTEPNPKSAAYIKYPGIVDLQNKRHVHLYAAGGFQGGKTEHFIKAMKECKKIIDHDLNIGYIPRWNDETAWNRYLYDNPEEISTVLNPSYVYPDSLIKEYYEPIWGKSYYPRLMTLTKPFTTSKEGGAAAAQMTNDLKNLK